MLRILLLIALFWILYTLLKRLIFRPNPDQKTVGETEKMVLCSTCGLHVPESESHISATLIICNNPQCSDTEKQNGN